MSLETPGIYRCEVSTEADFDTASQTVEVRPTLPRYISDICKMYMILYQICVYRACSIYVNSEALLQPAAGIE